MEKSTTRTLNARTARLAHEFVRLNTKFSRQNLNDRALSNKEVAENARQAVVQKENREFPELEAITAEDVANAVLEKLAYEREQRKAAQRDAAKRAEAERKALLVECPACGVRRRDPRFEHCAVCAKLDAENESLIKAGKLKPGTPLSLEEIDAIAEKQRSAAARELHKCYLINQLPAGCKVVKEEDKEVRIETPLGLFIIRAAEAVPAETSKVYGKRARRPRAQVHELSIEQVDQGWDDETVAA